MNFRLLSLPRLFATLGLCLLAAASIFAETFTLTDKQGRSIKADVVSVDGDQVKIKREDGQPFTLSLASLSEADQKKLKTWAAANPPRINPSELILQFGRAKFDTDKEDTSDYVAYKDQWGYNIELTNRSKTPLDKLRAEYVLFVKQDTTVSGGKPSFRRVKAATKVAVIEPLEKVSFRTQPVPSYRYVLKPGFYWSATGNSKPVRDTLEGMWLRIYSGDELLIEKITPETLAKTEKW